ncbi:putative membrane protein [Cinnamomum micranthum f. kanehirae]|uniref:Putative membrane protein n=1 Tax=Cinnamomum micranthum f. kanehirae TaxID=337451 RepID=A0A3S3MTM4_9MAGN|nr:putative membrane protein [Cinnamomum micranthum f. kanehirae]
MASSSSSSSSLLLMTLLSLSFLTNPSHSTTTNCSSQTFSKNRIFQTCNNLPQLNSSLHWTYNPSNSSLSLAFQATPPHPNGWIAWAINPTSKGMIGSQSLIAFHQPNGSMTVQTFDIEAYGPIKESPISIQVSDLEAEFSDGLMRIFATVGVANNATVLNQVWQVGGSVTGGVPDKHDFGQENLKAMGTVDLLQGESKQQQSNGATSAAGNQKQLNSIPSSSSLLSCCILFFSIFGGVWWL